MDGYELTLDGVVIEPYFQQYECSKESVTRRGELLSRPTGHPRVEEFFDGLDYAQQLAVFTWQLELKEEFATATDCRLSINVDNSLLDSTEQRGAFVDLVSRYPTPATFEFTETHPMPPVDVSNHLLRSIRELGHLTALDDFGTGLNGMSLLTDYDFDVVKVDRSLSFDIASRIEKQKTLKLINRMIAVLGKKHVVEGVEEDDVFRLLSKAGFTTFQGYLFHRPAPLRDAMARLTREGVSS